MLTKYSKIRLIWYFASVICITITKAHTSHLHTLPGQPDRPTYLTVISHRNPSMPLLMFHFLSRVRWPLANGGGGGAGLGVWNSKRSTYFTVPLAYVVSCVNRTRHAQNWLIEAVDKFSKKYPRRMQLECAAPLTLIYCNYRVLGLTVVPRSDALHWCVFHSTLSSF